MEFSNKEAAVNSDSDRLDLHGLGAGPAVKQQPEKSTWAQLKTAWQEYQEREVSAKEAAKKAATGD